MRTDLRRKISQRIGEAMGVASVCWIPKPTGVFDSTQASKAVDHVMKYTDALLDVAEAAKAYEHAQWEFGLGGSTRAGRTLDSAYKSLMEALKKLEEI